ncbi:hypothetical protein NI389_16245 [Pseudoalteromonas xiamenensis]|uniref:hypothetical protein n=1 Tax=Pseudoalteromonas xiamenensis TaxID=882626 RepID=UPI0027E411FC|nr:hypothetical protein [Pseudoalteromonas xiamenensis]WMN59709.1 hypothetical protein NI389_16245 [Pseudoalteromonas xiamenensis]
MESREKNALLWSQTHRVASRAFFTIFNDFGQRDQDYARARWKKFGFGGGNRLATGIASL